MTGVPSRDVTLVRVANWIARGLGLGWLATIIVGLVLPGGHPPLVFDFLYAVVVASLALAPIGIAMAGLEAWRGRRDTTGLPRRTLTVLRVNVLFLLVALVVTGWFFYAATYRPS
jgi:hypothetical protein